LADGRLDEAFEAAKSDDIRRHRHGQRLVGRLTRALVRRGRENLAAGRCQPALDDCNKAEKLAGNASEIAALRAAVCDAIRKTQQDHQQDALRVAQARQHMDDGWLSVGAQILEGSPGAGEEAERLRQELAAVRLQTDDAVAKARQALKRGDIEQAIDLARSARMAQNRNGRVAELLHEISNAVVQHIRTHLEQGRLDGAQALMQRLTPLAQDSLAIAELRRALVQCHQAAEFIAAGKPAAAAPLLRRVKAICPAAQWLDTALADVKRAAESLEELDTGPLGLSIAEAAAGQEPVNALPGDAVAPERHEQQGALGVERQMVDTADNSSVPAEFLMQVDGVGSYLVFREARVTVGPISSSARPDLGLIADPNLPVVTIERIDGDYFLRSQTPVDVNDESVAEKLLSDGDSIALSRRCRIRFHLPNPASATALLTVSGARLSRPDIRRIVLMDRDVLIGPYTNNHVRTDQLSEAVALFAQNGRLLCRAKEGVAVDGRPLDPNVGLVTNKRIEIGRLSLVVTRFEA
jgi:hypothetical protein